MIKLFEPHVGIEEIKSVKNVLQSKFWASGTGAGNVLKFENKFTLFITQCRYVGYSMGKRTIYVQ